MGKKRAYMVTITTSDRKKAGTNEDVWVQIIGTPAAAGEPARQTVPAHLDRGGYNDFEKGDVDTYRIVDEDIGEVTAFRVGLAAEGEYAGGVDLEVSAEHKGVAATLSFEDIQKWGSQHNSPMWHLDHVTVYSTTKRIEVDTKLFGRIPVNVPADEKVFTAERWINIGDVFTFLAD